MLAYQQLEKKFKRISNLEHLSSIAHWDEAVMMPAGGSQSRAEAQAEVSVMINEIMGSKDVGDLLIQAEHDQNLLNSWQKANLSEMKRAWLKATSVSPELVEAKIMAGSKCEMAWRSLRQENNWQDFVPLFKEVVKLSREEAKQRSEAMGAEVYDALLNLYEPGMTCAKLDVIFTEIKGFLPEFIQQVVDKQKSEKVVIPQGPFSAEKQRELGLHMMKVFGFNFAHGRLDVSHHPFCGGTPRDVRITTRYDKDDFEQSLLGVQHETGHALYEQGLPQEWLHQPVGTARSLGMHESQSLLYEMQVSRSPELLEFAAPIIAEYMADSHIPEESWTIENLKKVFTRVEPGYIRVAADEVTYPMHVILRYEIGKALMEESLEVEDLPEAWDEKMQAYLGLSTKNNYKDGCMQDIHWMDGTFGYFPTYTLGAMNAAQIFAAAVKDKPEIPANLSQGDFSVLNAWLEEKIWSQASFYSVDGLMEFATGSPLDSKYFVEHLKSRYL